MDSKYLGNPLFLTKRSEDFNLLKDKLQAKLNEWSKKCMPCLLLECLTICEELDAKVRKFWWMPRENKSRFLALKAWDHICQPKQCCVLGFGRF